MSPEFLLIVFLVIISFEFLLGKFLGILNYRSMRYGMPDELKDFMTEEQYGRSVDYNRVNARFTFLTSSLGFVFVFLLILTGFFGQLDTWIRLYSDNEIIIALIFFGILFLASDLLSLPFDLYDTFVIEEKFGFNKTSPSTYISDKLKGYLLTVLLGGGLLSLLLYLISILGRDFWFYFWVLFAAFMLFINMFYTTLILPWFNKLTPLEEGDLKQAIMDYCLSVGFPVTNIYVIDGSRRSSKSNAFFSGLGKKKKVVLYDTLINNHSSEELVAILAHEVGHYKKKHILWGFITSLLQSGLLLFILGYMVNTPELSQAFGSAKTGIHLNLLAFGILMAPLNHLSGILFNLNSRRNEFQADAYAASTYKGDPLSKALKKLSVDNLGHFTPHPLYVFMNYSHPPLLARLRALAKTT